MKSIQYCTKIALLALVMFAAHSISAAVFYIKNTSDWDISVKLDENPEQTIPAHGEISIGDPDFALPNILEMSVRRIGAADFFSRWVKFNAESLKIDSWRALATNVSTPQGYQRNLYWNIVPTTLSWDITILVVAQKAK